MRKPKRQAMAYEAQHDDPMTQQLLKDRRVSVILEDSPAMDAEPVKRGKWMHLQ